MDHHDHGHREELRQVERVRAMTKDSNIPLPAERARPALVHTPAFARSKSKGKLGAGAAGNADKEGVLFGMVTVNGRLLFGGGVVLAAIIVSGCFLCFHFFLYYCSRCSCCCFVISSSLFASALLSAPLWHCPTVCQYCPTVCQHCPTVCQHCCQPFVLHECRNLWYCDV